MGEGQGEGGTEFKTDEAMKIPGYYLLFTMFVTGAAILVIEILGARIISPYYGTSLYVWSSLITVTLISLAVGYWRGGVIADSSPDGERLYSMIFEGAIYLALVPFLKTYILTKASSIDLRLGALLSAFALFFLPLTLLSMVTPYAVRLAVGRIEDVGKTTGLFYAASTVGSFVGAIATGFILIPLLHVDKIVYLLSMVLALLVIVPWILNRRLLKVSFALGLITVCSLFLFRSGQLPHAGEYKVIYKSESPYGEVRVVDGRSNRTLMLNGIVQGQMNRSGYPVNKYFYFTDALIESYRPDTKDALVIGLGIGALPRILKDRRIKVDAVEIDPVVGDVARRFFGFNDDAGRLFIDDGRYFIENTRNSYDFVYLDTYASDTIPYHLFSMESFISMKKILRDRGVLAINFHDHSDGEKAVSTKAILKTLKMVFKDVQVFEVEPWGDGGYRNISFLASMADLTPIIAGGKMIIPSPVSIDTEGGVIISDGYNPIDIMYAPVAKILRETTQKGFAKGLLG